MAEKEISGVAEPQSEESFTQEAHEKKPLSKRILGVLWDSLDKSPRERALIAKLDWWILSYCCVAYFVKYLDQTNVRTRPRKLPKTRITDNPRCQMSMSQV
jgi:ACS family pantothenate transporter-like MFS transporter